VDHRVYPRQLIVFDDREPVLVDENQVPVEQPFVLTDNDLIQIRKRHIVYLAALARSSQVMIAGDVTTDEPPALEDVLDDASDPKIGASLEQRHFSAPASEWLEIPVTVTNLGELEASFEVKAEGLPHIEFGQTRSANLHAAGGEQTVVIKLRPQRVSANTANEMRPFWIIVRSPSHYPGRIVRLAATLAVPPFTEFAFISLRGAQEKHNRWWRLPLNEIVPRGQHRLELKNNSNCERVFQVAAIDPVNTLDMTWGGRLFGRKAPMPAQFRMQPNDVQQLRLFPGPRQPRWIGWWRRSHDWTMEAAAVEDPTAEPKRIPARLYDWPLLLTAPALVLLALLLACLGIVIARQQWPRIDRFAFTQDSIRHGDATTLEWEGSPNALFDIQSSDNSLSLIGQSSADGAIEVRPVVTNTTSTETLRIGVFYGMPLDATYVKPLIATTTYTIAAHNELSRGPIGAALLSVSQSPLGASMLSLLSPPFTIPMSTTVLTRGVATVPATDTTCFQPGELTTDPPTNPAVITTTMIATVTLTHGESLKVSWAGYRCVEKMSLYNGDAVASIPAAEIFEGQRILTPRADEKQKSIRLEASGFGEIITQTVNITVSDPPTPTPTPLPPPKIVRFDLKPDSIVVGEQVILEWKVSGVHTATLLIDGVPFTVDDEGAIFQRPISAGETVRRYQLEAIGEGGISSELRLLTIKIPTPVPTPEPRFVGKPDYDGYCGGEGKADLKSVTEQDVWKFIWVCKDVPEIPPITDSACVAQYGNGAFGKAVGNPKEKSSWECWR